MNDPLTTPEGPQVGRYLLLPAIALALAAAMSWTPYELIWGMWAASLVTGLVQILDTTLAEAFRVEWRARTTAAEPGLPLDPRDSPLVSMSTPKRWMLATFLAGFFTIHFTGFHLVQAVFLALLLPPEGAAPELAPMADSPATLLAAGEALLVRAWPVIALSLVNAWVAQPHRGHALHPFQPYRAVIRHHVLILVLGALRAAGNGGTEDTILYVASLACFAAFFLPPRAAPFDREGARDAASTEP